LARISRSSFRYSRHPRDDTQLAERLRTEAKRHPRYGYRRVWVLLRRKQRVNLKRVYRVWRAQGLCLPRRRPKKPRHGDGAVPCQATHPNHVWTYDFIHDACINGRKLKMLSVVDEFTRECLAIETATSLPGREVIAVLQRLFAEHGAPEFIRSDNGPEFIAKIIKRELAAAGAQTIYIEPGSPWQNGFVESFHGKFRDECLNMETFANLAEAKVVIEAWRHEYNNERPHSSLGYLTPLEFKAQWQRMQTATANGQKRPSLSLLGPTDGLDQPPPQTTMGRAPDLGPPSVRPPATALGSHSCVALPSERANRNVA
jgi:putative transposase